MRISNETIISAGDMSGNLSGVQRLDHVAGFSVQISWSGTSPVGTFKLQGSNDGMTWTDLTSQTISVSGNSGSGLLNYPDSMFMHLKAIYTASSGTGALNVGDYIDLRTSHSEASGRSLWNQSDRNYVVIKRVGGVG